MLFAAKTRRQKMIFLNQKEVKILDFRYMSVIHLKRKLGTCTIKIQKEKI